MNNKNKHKRIEWQKCPNCTKKFDTLRGLHIHKTRQMHWFEQKPSTPAEEQEHVNYRDLITNSYKSWGQDMPVKKNKRNIQRDQLSLGALFEIIHLLHELIAEVKRPR